MGRVDHYYDPTAPHANSIVVAAVGFIVDELDRVLLIERSDNGLWATPGGAQDVGEYISDTVVRETREETGIEVRVTGLVGVYSNPNHVMAYSNGEVRQQFSLCFRAEPVGGTLRSSSESKHVEWVRRERLDELNIHPSMRMRIDHGYENRPEPYIG